MTPRQVRAALRGRFSDAGFTEAGSAFVCQTPDLMHRVEVAAVRRLAGSIQIHHSVAPTGPAQQPVLTEELASHGHDSPYPRLWSAASVDGGLVLAQVLAIRRSFQTAQDLAHYFSDRHHPGDAMSVPHALPPSAANSLSAAEASAVMQRLAREILSQGFSRVGSQDDFECWSADLEVEGFRHCVYLEANSSCTLAVLVGFALPTKVVEGGLRSESARRQLMVAPKRVVFSAGRPLLLPMSAAPFEARQQVRSALDDHLGQHPPHRLPR